MSQSYFGWRISRILGAIGGAFKGVGRALYRFWQEWDFWLCCLIALFVVSGLIFLGAASIEKEKRESNAREAAANLKLDSVTVDEAAKVVIQSSKDAGVEPPVVAAAKPPPPPVKKEPVFILGWIKTGATNVQVLIDRQTGCEYIVVNKGPPVPRMFLANTTTGEKAQWCETPALASNVVVPADQPDP